MSPTVGLGLNRLLLGWLQLLTDSVRLLCELAFTLFCCRYLTCTFLNSFFNLFQSYRVCLWHMHCVQIHLIDIHIFYLQSGMHLLYAKDELPALTTLKLFSPEPSSAKTEHCYFPILHDLSAAFNTINSLLCLAILPSLTWLGHFLLPLP